MKNYFIIFLIAVLGLSGCAVKVKKETERSGNSVIKYPQVKNLKDRLVEYKINNLLYSKALELKNESAAGMLYDRGVKYSVEYDVSYFKGDVICINYKELLSVPWQNDITAKLTSITFNVANGRIYKLSDMFTKGSKYQGILNKIIKAKIINYGVKLRKNFNGIDKDQSFFLTEDSIAVYYQQGVYLPFSEGPLKILVEYSRLNDVLNKDLKLGQ